MDRADVQVVRLTPEQERERQELLARRMKEREDRLRAIRYNQFLALKAEFDALPPEQIDQTRTRAELLLDADRGAKNLGESLALAFSGLAAAAKRKIEALRRRFQWTFVRRYAIHHGLAALLILGGTFNVECVGADGATKWLTGLEFNGVTTAGLNHVLDTVFHGGTPVTTWYFGLVNGGTTPTYAAADTMGSHAGWTEYTTYSQTNRVAWDEGAASSGSTTNSVTSDFSMNGSGTVAGVFLTSSATKSGTTGTLFATANFSGGNQTVSNGDTLKVTYTINATAS
jgi:hypothetical protein